MSKEKSLTDAFDFVKKHYPNYEDSKLVQRCKDLNSLRWHEISVLNESSKILLASQYGGNPEDSNIEMDFWVALSKVYELSIVHFLKNNKS